MLANRGDSGNGTTQGASSGGEEACGMLWVQRTEREMGYLRSEEEEEEESLLF